MSADNILNAINISKAYGKNIVFDNISFTVTRGESLGIVGPSGCGKSTLLKVLSGLEDLTSGEIYFNDINISNLTPNEWETIRMKMGYAFQYSALFDFLTVEQNVGFMLYEHSKLKRKEIEEKVAHALELVGLNNVQKQYPYQLSGGMQKRVSFARAIISNPEIIFFDEPTAGLDPIATTRIDNLMKSIHHQTGSTSIIVTHHLSTIEHVCDRVLVLYAGKIHYDGSVQGLFKSEDPAIVQFIKGEVEGPMTSKE
jgi:phospholipid/cholesterol/gamma-HCH transport system ATP-binding protein